MTKLTDQGRVKNSSKRHKSHTGTPSNSDEDHGDLRGMLNERRHDQRKNKTLEESQRSVKVVYENRSKPYNASSRQYGHNIDHKGSSAKSGRERSGLTDDDRRPQWESTLEYENRDSTGPHRRFRPRSRHLSNRSNKSSGSDSDGRSNGSKRSRESERTKRRYRQESPIRTR